MASVQSEDFAASLPSPAHGARAVAGRLEVGLAGVLQLLFDLETDRFMAGPPSLHCLPAPQPAAVALRPSQDLCGKHPAKVLESITNRHFSAEGKGFCFEVNSLGKIDKILGSP